MTAIAVEILMGVRRFCITQNWKEGLKFAKYICCE